MERVYLNNLYDMIFKRKSFRRFDKALTLTDEEMQKIVEYLDNITPIVDDIKIKYRIVKRELTTCKWGEYCLLIYSEKKENYLLNIGYTFEQLDLWLASQNIGVCWHGIARPDNETYYGLDYVIMLAFGKSRPEDFRKDYTKAKRMELDVIWKGQYLPNVTEVVRYSPSACNSQPWRVVFENQKLRIFRTTDVYSIFPKEKLLFYNCIDMGIFLCILEVSLLQKGYKFERVLCKEQTETNPIETAQYLVL